MSYKIEDIKEFLNNAQTIDHKDYDLSFNTFLSIFNSDSNPIAGATNCYYAGRFLGYLQAKNELENKAE